MARQNILLIFVGILVLIKFGFGQLNELRSESRELLEVKNKRYVKGKSLLDTETQLDEQLVAVNNSLDKAKEFYLISDSAQNARLEIQRRVNDVATKHNLILESVEWLAITEGQPERAVLDLRFSGKFDALAKLHLEVEGLGAWIKVQQMSANVRNQKMSRNAVGTAKGSLLFDVFYIVDGDQ